MTYRALDGIVKDEILFAKLLEVLGATEFEGTVRETLYCVPIRKFSDMAIEHAEFVFTS